MRRGGCGPRARQTGARPARGRARTARGRPSRAASGLIKEQPAGANRSQYCFSPFVTSQKDFAPVRNVGRRETSWRMTGEHCAGGPRIRNAATPSAPSTRVRSALRHPGRRRRSRRRWRTTEQDRSPTPGGSRPRPAKGRGFQRDDGLRARPLRSSRVARSGDIAQAGAPSPAGSGLRGSNAPRGSSAISTGDATKTDE